MGARARRRAQRRDERRVATHAQRVRAFAALLLLGVLSLVALGLATALVVRWAVR